MNTLYPFYQSCLELDRESLRANARQLQKNLAPGVRSMAVVKANAYGHGASLIAPVLADTYDAFAVANVAEGMELRDAGITRDILVFGVPVREAAGTFLSHDLIAVVSAPDHFRLLKSGTRYHMEIDTGMGRLGFSHRALEEVARMVEERADLHCEGVMTHFATADESGSSHMELQKERFREMRSFFYDRLPDSRQMIFHAANSAASLDHPDSHGDMVRHGIALYGYDPTPDPSPEFRPVMRWKSRVADCKIIRKGDTVSYGATWEAPADGRLAIIPSGYADGYRRNLSGLMPVEIDGKWYPQAGCVTMDYIMVWLGDDRYKPGTEVTLMGGERNHAALWADAIGTIPYEICCGIHPNIPRKLV
ncbi:alanine racemase [Balneolales bacterium ANBcel1]|nr:alanine racemase [Balneolales bacterium ANBcel1]